MSKQHQKHAKLARPSGGAWGRVEFAVIGAPCGVIRQIAQNLSAHFEGKARIGFVDAGHHPAHSSGSAAVQLMDNGAWQQIDVTRRFTSADQRMLFNECDLVLVNGNHFEAQQQIVLVHPDKSLDGKLAKLTDIQLVLLTEDMAIPDCLTALIQSVPVLSLNDDMAVFSFFEIYLEKRVPELNGLVLAGGQSQRMGSDKSTLQYHHAPQRDHVFGLMLPVCQEVFISCNAPQAATIDLPKIEDRFLGIGPVGGILSAFQSAPDTAWLVVATDMPYLSTTTLNYLIEHRDPSKLATAFVGKDGLPEPLITIWEPRAYPVLLQALSMGLSCPRKILTAHDTLMLQPPEPAELQNINLPSERDVALEAIQQVPAVAQQ